MKIITLLSLTVQRVTSAIVRQRVTSVIVRQRVTSVIVRQRVTSVIVRQNAYPPLRAENTVSWNLKEKNIHKVSLKKRKAQIQDQTACFVQYDLDLYPLQKPIFSPMVLNGFTLCHTRSTFDPNSGKSLLKTL